MTVEVREIDEKEMLIVMNLWGTLSMIQPHILVKTELLNDTFF